MKKDKILHFLSYATILFAMAFMLWVAYMILWPVKVFEVDPSPMEVVTKEIRPGDNFVYIARYCSFNESTVRFTPQLRDGTVVSFPTRTTSIKEGCFEAVSNSLEIPANTPPGVYNFRFVNEVEINPLRTITIISETEQFTVLPKE